MNFAHVAQEVERRLGKAEVTGSNPAVGSIFILVRNARNSFLVNTP